jgi:DNA-binding response OmpR family regulator
VYNFTMPEASERAAVTVLVVEDHRQLRSILCRLLRRGGYAVLEARNGTEAMRVACDHLAGIDLLLTDVSMPDLSGPDLAAELRSRHAGLRTLFVTGHGRGDARLGDDDVEVLCKPFTDRELIAAVRRVLASS